MAYTPVAGQTFGFNDPQVQQIQQQYGFTPQQLQGLQQGKAGQPTPSLGLGTTGYNLTMGAGGGNYMISGTGQPQPSALAPTSIAGGSSSSSTVSTPKPGPSAGSIGMTTSTPNTTPATGATLQSSFRNALLGQLNQDPNKVSLTDPDLAPQVQAYSNAQQRGVERSQQELAELAFAGGTGGTGAYGNELKALEQQRAESEGQFNAGLLGQAKQQRLASLFQALGLGGEQLTADEALRLQRELGLGDLNVRGTDVANDYQLGLGQLELGRGNLGLGLLQAMLQDKQYGLGLGANMAQFGANLNLQSVLPFLK